MHDLSISVHFARVVLQNAVPRGLDPINLLRKNRISPRLLLEPNARISVERFADLQVDTMLAMQDEGLGYTIRPVRIGTWSMMCNAVIGSDNLGQALNRLCRFYQLFEFGVEPALEEHKDKVVIRLNDSNKSDHLNSPLGEMALFNIHRFASWLIQEHLPLQLVELGYPATAQYGDYRNMFLGNPVSFDCERTCMSLAKNLVDKPVVQNEASLRHFLLHPVLIMLTGSYASKSWTAKVRIMLRNRLDDMPELKEVAENFEVHPQTLRRRLSKEGTSFMELKNQTRRDTALYFLGKHGLSIEEIAHRSGFSESSAFIRAFKGWTGVTPYTYRKGL